MKYWQLKLCVLERLEIEAGLEIETGPFKQIVKGRSIKLKDATHTDNKQKANEWRSIMMKKIMETKRWVCCMQKIIWTIADLWYHLRQLCI